MTVLMTVGLVVGVVMTAATVVDEDADADVTAAAGLEVISTVELGFEVSAVEDVRRDEVLDEEDGLEEDGRLLLESPTEPTSLDDPVSQTVHASEPPPVIESCELSF